MLPRLVRLCQSVKPIKNSNMDSLQTRAEQLCANWNDLLRDIDRCGLSTPTIVAVSKTKPASDIKVLYDLGHRHFGENYVHEIVEKAPLLPADIKWHFIGHLQSNKVKTLLSRVPNLYLLETVDSVKKATLVNKVLEETASSTDRLRVYVQVNTSGEDSKSGANVGDACNIVTHIVQSCPRLQFEGLMTIGSMENSNSRQGSFNPDFTVMQDLKSRLLSQRIEPPIALSMGMSLDYIEAIKCGSNSVRVGSRIFGSRS